MVAWALLKFSSANHGFPLARSCTTPTAHSKKPESGLFRRPISSAPGKRCTSADASPAFQLALLVSLGIEPKFISPSHLLPFLPCDVLLHRRLGHAADGGREIAAAPQRGQAGAKNSPRTWEVNPLNRAAISATQRLGSDWTNRGTWSGIISSA